MFLETRSKFFLYCSSVVGKPSMSLTIPSFVVIIVFGNDLNMAVTNFVNFFGVENVVVCERLFFMLNSSRTAIVLTSIAVVVVNILRTGE